MGDKIRQFTAKELERLLIRFGFVLISQKGKPSKVAQLVQWKAGHCAVTLGKISSGRHTQENSYQCGNS